MAGGGVKINNITVSGGADGKTPIFKIEAGYLYNSYDNGTTWYSLGEVKGQDGQDGLDGSTGAKIVSLEYQNQDAYGGYIYLMTFDNGTTAYFTAPRGESGANVYYYQADEDDDWFTAIPETIPSGGLEQYGDTSYCEKVYEGQRDVKVGDLVIMYSPNANSKGQNTVFAVMKEIGGPDNCILQIVSFCEGDKGEQGEQGNLIYSTTEMMDGYTENGQPNLNQDLQYIVVNKIDSSGYSRSPQANDYIIAENFTTNDIFALFRVDYILANRYYCTKIMRLTGQKGANGVGLPSVTVADAGKFAMVGESGTWEAKTIPFAEGGEF